MSCGKRVSILPCLQTLANHCRRCQKESQQKLAPTFSAKAPRHTGKPEHYLGQATCLGLCAAAGSVAQLSSDRFRLASTHHWGSNGCLQRLEGRNAGKGKQTMDAQATKATKSLSTAIGRWRSKSPASPELRAADAGGRGGRPQLKAAVTKLGRSSKFQRKQVAPGKIWLDVCFHDDKQH